jgi:hypothetical protein
MPRCSWLRLLWLLPISAITAILTWYASHDEEGWFNEHSFMLVVFALLTGLIMLLLGIWQITGDDEKRIQRRRYAFGVFIYSIALNIILPFIITPISYGEIHRNYRGCVMLLLAPLVWVGVTSPARGEWVRGAGAWLVLFAHHFVIIYGFAHGWVVYPCGFRYLE